MNFKAEMIFKFVNSSVEKYRKKLPQFYDLSVITLTVEMLEFMVDLGINGAELNQQLKVNYKHFELKTLFHFFKIAKERGNKEAEANISFLKEHMSATNENQLDIHLPLAREGNFGSQYIVAKTYFY